VTSSGLLARVGAWLVAPPAVATARPAPVVVAAGSTPEVAVLAASSDVASLAAALALRLTRGTAAIAVWTGDAPSRRPRAGLPPVLGARRLAASLAARDLSARAAGRLVTVALPAGERAAAVAASRLTAAVREVPVVLAVGGPRGEAWDRVLADCDLVAVHSADATLAQLATDRLVEQGVRAIPISAPGAGARRLARAGLALPGVHDPLTELARAVAP
jgi:DNA-binding LacI/PurR family transcriptional regulator